MALPTTIECVPLDAIFPCETNPRKHDKAKIKRLAETIRAFGMIVPIVVDSENRIVAGNARLQAAKQLGFEKAPIIQITHLSEGELQAYQLADNKLAADATWDEELLKVQINQLLNLKIDLDLTGFVTPEIDGLLIEPLIGDGEDPEELEPPDPAQIVTSAGDIWHCGEHRIACADARDSTAWDLLMHGELARMSISDPPYNVKIDGHVSGLGKPKHAEFAMASGEMSPVEFTGFLRTALAPLAQFSLPGSLHYVFMDWRHLGELQAALNDTFDGMVNFCVWNKTNGGMGSLYRSQHELVLISKFGNEPHVNNVELGKHGRHRTNVWTYPGMNAFSADRDESLALHPTVKPTPMIADAILDVTHRDDIVLDAFLGSGTTLLAAHQTGRRCVGVELEPGYVDVCIRRWQQLSGEQAVHAGTGRPFDELREELEHDGEGTS
jgi:DNA modification methylase